MSTPIPASAVNELRKRTDMPMMDCKSALVEANGDMDKAVMLLRSRNSKISDKRALNETTEGRVAIVIDHAAKAAAIVELRCESAPVAKSEQFQALGKDIGEHVIQERPETVEAMLTQKLAANNGQSVTERINDVIGLIRENMKVERFVRLNGEQFGEYVHHDGSLGVLVQVTGKAPASAEVLRDICSHIAAMNPAFTRIEQIPAEVVTKETDFAKQQAATRAEGKPAQVIEKIAEGLLKTWYAENALLEQPMVNATKYDKKTVGQLLKENGLELVTFVRFKVGEKVVA